MSLISAPPTAMALLGYIALFVALTFALVIPRAVLVLMGRRAANAFTPGGTELSPLAARIARAHANCYENFPLIGGLMLLALVTGQAAVTDALAPWFLAARVAQATVHLISTGVWMVQVRFAFFALQLGIGCVWVVGLWGALG